jgi:hypothetical protein
MAQARQQMLTWVLTKAKESKTEISVDVRAREREQTGRSPAPMDILAAFARVQLAPHCCVHPAL